MALIKRKTEGVQPLRLSWSSIQSFLSCQRKYDLTYRENIQRIPSAASRLMMLGSTVHAGIEAALQAEFEIDYHQNAGRVDWLVTAAVTRAREYVEQSTIPNKKIKDYSNGGVLTLDQDYYNMMREVSQLAVSLLRFHIPLIGLGDRYLVPTVRDVVSGLPPEYRHEEGQEPIPAIEWHFEFPVDENTILSGYIDTILWDTVEQEYVIVDWKTRGSFPDDRMALIDGQLHLYAAVVNSMAEHINGVSPINRVMMYQLKTKTPSPASIHAKTGIPNTGARSYDTTWEVWKATLPKGIDPDRYWNVMKDKVKQPSEFQHPVMGAVTDTSSQLAVDNVKAAVYAIRAALESGTPLPAILSSNKCQWCDFTMLCTNVLRYGGDPSSILSEFYQPRSTDAIELEMAEE